jgi:hypothetical protein
MLHTGNKVTEIKNLGTPYSCVQYQMHMGKQVMDDKTEVETQDKN